MPQTRTYLLVEERLGRSLRRHVSTARRNGKSWNAIARDLHDQTKTAVTSETLRIWFADLAKTPAPDSPAVDDTKAGAA